jgi:hypothetical protein
MYRFTERMKSAAWAIVSGVAVVHSRTYRCGCVRACVRACVICARACLATNENRYGVDIRGNVGNRVISSDMTIQLTRSDQRKGLLRARIDNHVNSSGSSSGGGGGNNGGGTHHKPSRPLPPKEEQLRLFQMFNSFKQDRIE